MQIMTLKEIAKAVNGELSGSGETLVSQVSTDTRTITKGCLYIAIVGESFDGHDFIEKAFELGASAVISHKKIEINKPVVYVENTRLAFGVFAAYYRRLFNPYVVGVTGSVGKTSTKEMIYTVISSNPKYKVLKTKGNFNNDIGLPRTLLELDKSCKAAVIEMGMSSLGEISYLSKIANPNLAVITNIGVSHLGKLKTRENILKAKLEILDGMDENARIILNADNDLLSSIRFKMGDRALYFGIENNANVTASGVKQVNEVMEFAISFAGKIYPAVVPSIGVHNVYNALAAFLVGIQMGMSPEEIVKSFLKYKNSGMRQNISERDGIKVIADCYNASPDSMQSAVEVISKISCDGKRIAVFGDMLELGDDSNKMHTEVGEMVAKSDIDILICCGKEGKYICEGARAVGHKHSEYFADKAELTAALKSIIKVDDAIIFKASRGIRLEKVIDKIFE